MSMSFKRRVLYGEGVCLRTSAVADVRLWSWLQVIFSQQVIGYPRRRDLALTCELFGLAGHYVLTLRSKLYTAVPVMDSEPAHLKVHAYSSEFAPHYLLESGASRCQLFGHHHSVVTVIFRFDLRPVQNI